jgi:hypothetical protein
VSRARGLAILALAGGLATPAPAFAYPALAPAPIRIDHNAAAIALACTDGKKKLDGHGCAAYAFCHNPFDAGASAPSVEDLAQIAAGHCPPDPSSPTVAALATRGKDVSAFASQVKSITGLGTAWQGDVLTGLANFLVARAKAELIASFVFQLKSDLCTAEVKPVLPTTCALLASADPYAVPVSWSALKTAFETDLRGLPEALINRLSTGDKAEPLRALVQAIALISQGAEPLDSVAGLRVKYAEITTSVACDHAPYACALLVLGNAVEILAPSPLANQPIADPTVLELQLKIAARLLKDVGGPIGVVADIEARLDHYRSLLQDLIGRLINVRSTAMVAQRSANAVPMTATRTARAVATQASFDNYARCVSNAFAIAPMAQVVPALAQDTSTGGFDAVIDHLGLALEHARAGEYVPAFVEVQAALAAANLDPPAWFTKYGGFLTDVAAAQSPADAQAAIEAAAAPVGSWRQKRGAGRRTLWINGYVGGQLGAEWLVGAHAPGGAALHGGLFAPIGLEADLGFGRAWSIGVLASVLDLGALVDIRSSSTSGAATVNNNANVGARQVFSPGAYVVVGLGLGNGGIPISVGLGASLSPELRSVDLGDGTTRDVNALRVNGFLAVDVSIFGL